MGRMGKLFVEGALKRDVDKDQARKIFELMATFAGHGYLKSHAAAYAVVTIRTAFLKANYPKEFMETLLFSELDDTERYGDYADKCRAMELAQLANLP